MVLNLRLFFLIITISSFTVSKKMHKFRIVGGSEAELGEFPYQISLRWNETGEHVCGGSILNESFILTAAHCIRYKKTKPDFTAKDLFIIAGDLEKDPNDTAATIRKVKKVTMHPKFDLNAYEGDIALLELTENLPTFNKSRLIKPIPLNDKEIAANTTCVVTGWGATEEGGRYNKALMKVHVVALNLNVCKEKYKNYAVKIQDGMLCAAGFGKDGKPVDACQGDSGGPLVCNERLVGVVSWGQGCARPDYPGVYTNVVRYLPWIEDEELSAATRYYSNNHLRVVTILVIYYMYYI